MALPFLQRDNSRVRYSLPATSGLEVVAGSTFFVVIACSYQLCKLLQIYHDSQFTSNLLHLGLFTCSYMWQHRVGLCVCDRAIMLGRQSAVPWCSFTHVGVRGGGLSCIGWGQIRSATRGAKEKRLCARALEQGCQLKSPWGHQVHRSRQQQSLPVSSCLGPSKHTHMCKQWWGQLNTKKKNIQPFRAQISSSLYSSVIKCSRSL